MRSNWMWEVEMRESGMIERTLSDGRYRLKQVLGEGGMATVYLAQDNVLGAQRAIKILSPHLRNAEAIRHRFMEEARAMARIAHANIVSIHDVGIAEDGSPFIVMEFMTAGSAADLLQSGPLQPAIAGTILKGVLAGLQAAHDHGVVHRDIKPPNILISANGVPKITDFGIAQHQTNRHTKTHAKFGSAGYMPPEQQQSAKQAGPGADIYAAGATLFALLTGEEPFELHTAEAQKALTDKLEPSITELISRACQYNPDDRFDEPTVMASALEAAFEAAGTPLPSSRITMPARPVPATTLDQDTLQDFPTSQRPSTTSRAWKRRITGLLLALAGGICVELIASHVATLLSSSSSPPEESTVSVSTAEECGDGIVSGNEDCDDGNENHGDLCTPTCEINTTRVNGGSMWMGFTQADLKAGMHLEIPSRKSEGYIHQHAEFATPATPVMVPGFNLMRTEVSWGAFRHFVESVDPGDVGSVTTDPDIFAWHTGAIQRTRDRYKGTLQDRPARNPAHVDVEGAIAFCSWLGGALPTEAQWEMAARGAGTGRLFPWGDRVPKTSPEDCDLMTGYFVTSMNPHQEFNCGGKQPTPVGSLPAGCTPEGVCDLSGNVDEFVIPGPVRWNIVDDAGEEHLIADLPGPLSKDPESMEFMTSCTERAIRDPYGLISGSVRDCLRSVRNEPLADEAQYRRDGLLLVVRGGNYDESLPLYYQNRARYPWQVDQVGEYRGFRCTIPAH